ncbi:hypothetical protein SOVF_193200 [Spinacia oleracea]|nr:hypothetical protein SOVF_193200 [Spinacia oleracea]
MWFLRESSHPMRPSQYKHNLWRVSVLAWSMTVLSVQTHPCWKTVLILPFTLKPYHLWPVADMTV